MALYKGSVVVPTEFGRYIGTVPNAGVAPEASPTRTMDWIATAEAVHYISFSLSNSEEIMEIRRMWQAAAFATVTA